MVGVGCGKAIVEKAIVHVPGVHDQHQQWEAKCRVCTLSEMWWDSIWLLQYFPPNHYQYNHDNNVQQIVIEAHPVAYLIRPIKSLKVIENKASLKNIQCYEQLKEAWWLSAIGILDGILEHKIESLKEVEDMGIASQRKHLPWKLEDWCSGPQQLTVAWL